MKGNIFTIREVVILPCMTIVAKGITNLMKHSKCMNVVAEPVVGYWEHIAMARSYGVLKPGRGKTDFCLRYHSVKQITLPQQTAAGEIATAKIILALLALKSTVHETGKCESTTRKRKYESQKNYWAKLP